MKEKLIRFMAGRNGTDSLNLFLLGVYVVLLLISSIFIRRIGAYLQPLFLLLLGVIVYRTFSRNLERRRKENAWYMEKRMKFLGSIRLLRERWVQRKDYCFFRCPSCRTTLRVPKGRGKIKIVCRKCGTSFMRKS